MRACVGVRVLMLVRGSLTTLGPIVQRRGHALSVRGVIKCVPAERIEKQRMVGGSNRIRKRARS